MCPTQGRKKSKGKEKIEKIVVVSVRLVPFALNKKRKEKLD